MRPATPSFSTLLRVLAASSLAVACGGGASPSAVETSADRSGASALVTPAAPRDPLLARAGFPRSKIAPSGLSQGSVQFAACVSGALCTGPTQTSFAASFTPDSAPAVDGGPTCTVAGQGSCEVITCTGGGSGGVPPGVSAGTLTIGGGAFGSVPLTARRADGFQYVFDQAGVGFSPGDVLTVEGSGGKVAAFPTQSLAASGAVTLDAPKAKKDGDYAIATSAGLELRWSGGTPGDLFFIEGDGSTSTSQVTFECAWDAAQGHGFVGASIMAPMAGSSGDLLWGQETVAIFDAAKYSVNYAILTYGAAAASYE